MRIAPKVLAAVLFVVAFSRPSRPADDAAPPPPADGGATCRFTVTLTHGVCDDWDGPVPREVTATATTDGVYRPSW